MTLCLAAAVTNSIFIIFMAFLEISWYQDQYTVRYLEAISTRCFKNILFLLRITMDRFT